MVSPNLRVTRRCLDEDLGLSSKQVEESVLQDARDFKSVHAAVRKFVSMRGAAPDGAEPIYGPFPRGRVGSLHVGEARAATTWDEREDVCWLLAYNDYHRNGDPDDAYNVFIDLYNRDELMPTQRDYDDFLAEDDVDEELVIEGLLEIGAELLARARANPGREEVKTWSDGGHQVMCVDVLVVGQDRAEEGWLGLTLPQDVVLTNEQVYDLVQALLPPDAMPRYEKRFKDRPRRPGEIVFQWDHYESA